MIFYVIGIILTSLMLWLVPLSAFLASKGLVILLVAGYCAIYLLFIYKKPLKFIRSHFSYPLLVTLFILLFTFLYFIFLKQQISVLIAGKIIIVFLLPLLVLLFAKSKPGEFHGLDLLVFLMVFISLESRFVSLPLVYEKNILSFDGIFMAFVLFVLFIYLGYRKIEMGYQLDLTKKMAYVTVMLTILLLSIEITLGTRLHFLTFVGWNVNLKDIFVLGIFFFFHAALVEEIFFRGLIYNYMSQFLKKFNFALPLLFNTILFGVTHLNNGGFPMLLLSTLAGFFYCFTYIITGNIFCAAFIHTATNLCWRLFFVIN
ncbi:MAG: hypothetical protein DKM50_13800 [Candidatus Margulisiibacteriota bacterium]|nr:MAG: hypothetical protein DKM50_13800 [Candidatus Margulisiibacteriota bacterium]